MKRNVFILLIVCIMNVFADDDPYYKRTFFSEPPSFRPTTPEMISIFRDRLDVCYDEKQYLKVIALGTISINSAKIAKYFSPVRAEESFIAGELGSHAAQSGQIDVIANYFNVLTAPLPIAGDPADLAAFENYTFQSKLTLDPQQLSFGFAFNYHRHLSKTQDCGWWLDLTFPFKWVKNDLRLCEKVINAGGPGGNDPQVPNGFFPNMTEAFKSQYFKFGRIDGAQTAFGLADIYAMVGYTYFNNDSRHFDSFFGLIVPTSNKPKAEFLFEPIFGNEGHAGLMSGTSIGFRLWQDKCRESAFYWELDMVGTLLAENSQTRSFDLKDKTWGRYMWVYLNNKSTTTTPGINIFTKQVDVKPGTSRDLNLAYVFEHPRFRAEFGYHYFARAPEKVTLASPWNETVAIATIINGDNEFVASAASKTSRDRSTISDYLGVLNDTNPANDPTVTADNVVYRTIKENDLDLISCSHPATVVHTFYGALSYHWGCGCKNAQYIGIGFAYDFGPDNATFDRFEGWAKYGIEF